MSEGESLDDFSVGDLGLGDGLRPGGIPITTELCTNMTFTPKVCGIVDADRQDQSNGSTGFTTPDDSEDEYEISLTPIRAIQELKQQCKPNTSKSSRCTETFPKLPDDSIYDCRYFQVSSCECQESDCPSPNNGPCRCEFGKGEKPKDNFPVYADVPFGTSLRQQRELFQHNMEELSKKKVGTHVGNRENSDGKSNKRSNVPSLRRQEEIAMKLAKTLQEVDDLKLELDTCEKRLGSKYQAIDILKKQAEDAQLQLKNSETFARERTIKLAQLQYSGDGSASSVTSHVVGKDQDLGDMSHMIISASSQSTPIKTGETGTKKTVSLDKHRSVCQENAFLMDGLQSRTEELRKMTAQKMAIERENDELLALLDIQERQKYEKTRSVSSEENYNTFTSSELAVLGACRCRGSDPDPCRCAHAAASMKKEVYRMKEEVLQFKNRRDEAFLTVDAYRKAFEEQLQKNRTLTMQLATIASNSQTKAAKAKSAFRWLMGSLDDDDDLCDAGPKPGPLMSEHEVITYLTELVNEKREVLAHQKLASQILGDKVRHLEDKLSRYEKESDVFS